MIILTSIKICLLINLKIIQAQSSDHNFVAKQTSSVKISMYTWCHLSKPILELVIE